MDGMDEAVGSEQIEPGEGVSRRDAIKKAAVGAAAAAWAAPAVQTLTQVPAFAQGTPVCPDISTTTEDITGVVRLMPSGIVRAPIHAMEYGELCNTICDSIVAAIAGGVVFGTESTVQHRIETTRGDTICYTTTFFIDFCDAYNDALAQAYAAAAAHPLMPMLVSFTLGFGISIEMCPPRGNVSLTPCPISAGSVSVVNNGAPGCTGSTPFSWAIVGNNVRLNLPGFQRGPLSTPVPLCPCEYTATACYTVPAGLPVGDTIIESGTPQVFGTFRTGTVMDIGGSHGCTVDASVNAACWSGGPATGLDASGNPTFTPGDPLIEIPLCT